MSLELKTILPGKTNFSATFYKVALLTAELSGFLLPTSKAERGSLRFFHPLVGKRLVRKKWPLRAKFISKGMYR